MSRRHAFLALAALAVTLLPLGCGGKWNDPAIPSLPQNDIVPFALGNRWTYIDSTFNRSNGALLSVDSTAWTITGKQLVNVSGRLYDVWGYQQVNPATQAIDSLTTFLGTTPNGLYFYGAHMGTTNATFDFTMSRELRLRYPANLNDTWIVHDVQFNGSGFTVSSDSIMQCSAPSTPFDTPRLGTVSCTEYDLGYYFFYANDPNHSHRYDRRTYYRAGVGQVGVVEVLDGLVIHSRRLKQVALFDPN